MNMTHTNGRHAYKGILNSRSQRQLSKLRKGLNINLWKVNKAFRKLDADRQKQIQTDARKGHDRVARVGKGNDSTL